MLLYHSIIYRQMYVPAILNTDNDKFEFIAYCIKRTQSTEIENEIETNFCSLRLQLVTVNIERKLT